MTSLIAWGIALGTTLGMGLWTLAALIPRLGRPRLHSRIAPYVRDFSPGARAHMAQHVVDPLPVLGDVVARVAGRCEPLFSLAGANRHHTKVLLRQAGLHQSVERFRSEQLLFGIGGLAAGIVVAAQLSARAGQPIISAAVVLFAVAGSMAFKDVTLKRAAARRGARIRNELPTVLELLTLSLSAGEGIHDAVRRVANRSKGDFALELSSALARVTTGVPLPTALEEMAAQLQLPDVTRLVEQFAGALDRGTPLVEVLRAQAQDSREQHKRTLLESAGKKEVAMLFPLVFLILPITIVFAILPGVIVLQSGL